MSSFIISADLGQVNDYTAITIFEIIAQKTEFEYHLRHIERPELGTTYPKIVDRIQELAKSDKLGRKSKTVVIDITGGGRPVWDMMDKALYGVNMKGITITGGNSVSKEGGIYYVPKRDLVSALQIAFQNGQLKIAKGLTEADTLVKELTNFKVKININGHDQYEAWRESIHDDIVLSAAMAVWLANQSYFALIGIKSLI